MQQPNAIHNTFVLERSYPVTPERVFAAFADPARKRRWFAEGDHHKLESYSLDFREGGTEHYSSVFKEGLPVSGLTIANEIVYQNIVPNSRIVFASTMTIAGKCISVTLGTVELLPTEGGTDLLFTHQGVFFEGSGGVKMREEGWRKLFENLAKELKA